jgi:cob(I)alamin adenosyltransferase
MMKIYTKTGDKGETSLIGGKRVPKYHERIEAYGTVDELIAFTGLLRDQEIDEHTQNMLLNIQDRLMVCASILASDCDDCQVKIPKLYQEDILLLEQEIDTMEANLIPLNSFILPGGHQTVSFCHVARTICRRSERLILKLRQKTLVPDEVIRYLNRLSDYFFVLSRKLSVDLQAIEHSWIPKL